MTNENDERDDAVTAPDLTDESGVASTSARPLVDPDIFMTPALREQIARMRLDVASYQTPAMRDSVKRIMESQMPKSLKETMQNVLKSQVQLAGLEEVVKRNAPKIGLPDLTPGVEFPSLEIGVPRPDFDPVNVEPVSPVASMDYRDEVAETARIREERAEAQLQAAIETRDATIIAAQAIQAQGAHLITLTDYAKDEANSREEDARWTKATFWIAAASLGVATLGVAGASILKALGIS